MALTSLPTNLTTIRPNAFTECTNLKLTSLPASLTYIGHSAFENCTSLTTLDLSNVTFIYYATFKGCTSLVSVTLGGTVAFDTFVNPFDGDLRTVYSGAGTYVRDDGDDMTWEKLP